MSCGRSFTTVLIVDPNLATVSGASETDEQEVEQEGQDEGILQQYQSQQDLEMGLVSGNHHSSPTEAVGDAPLMVEKTKEGGSSTRKEVQDERVVEPGRD